MALTYDAINKRWNKVYEKTDYNELNKADEPTNTAANYQKAIDNYIAAGGKNKDELKNFNDLKAILKKNDDANDTTNTAAAKLNKDNATLNEANTKLNEAYDKVVGGTPVNPSIVTSTIGQDYTKQRKRIRELGIDAETIKNIEANFKDFYKTEKVTLFDVTEIIKPLSRDGLKELEVDYYKTQAPAASATWDEAVKDDDLDILARYGSEKDYFNWHYSTQGKQNGIRAYKEDPTTEVTDYKETLLDSEKQELRDIADEAKAPSASFDALLTKILGTKEKEDVKKYGALVKNVLKDTVDELTKMKAKEQEWDLYRGLEGFSEIADLNKTLSSSMIGDIGVGGFLPLTGGKSKEELTEGLEKQLGSITGLQNNVTYNWQKWFDETLTNKYGIDYKDFDATEDTIDIINAAIKTKPDDIYDKTNNKFKDAFIKEAGFKTSEELFKFLEDQKESGASLLSNLQNSSIDTTKLEEMKGPLQEKIKTLEANKDRNLKLTFTGEGNIPEEVKIDAGFARDFIDKYLKPRFDYSKSMSEFIDYMNVDEKNKNPFQTTDRLETVKTYTREIAKAIAPTLGDEARNVQFNPDFYFDPSDPYTTELKQENYKKQKGIIEQDWNTAKEKPDTLINGNVPALGTWRQNAELYNIKLEDKGQFARLHYQIIGKDANLDAALDPGSILKKELETPVNTKAQSLGTVFGEFITPEGFADLLLKNIDPFKDKPQYQELLKKYNLSKDAGFDDLKDTIINTIKTDTAAEIRNKIKILQEEDETPTQKELGVSYIERSEDKDVTTEKTELYNTFKTAGYKGTEKEFYTDYMPDADPSDVKLLTDVAKGKMPELDIGFLKSKDPFEMLSKITDIDSPPPKISTKPKTDSYFKLGIDDDEDEEDDNETSSIDADSFLGDYTSFFKK